MPVMPDMLSEMRKGAGAEEPPMSPVTPEDITGEATVYENPVASATPEPGYAGSMPGPEPLNVESASSTLPLGPEADMPADAKEDMYDMLAQRAKARMTRSEYFQKRAQEMAGKYF